MPTVELEFLVKRPPEAVFAYIANMSRLPEWDLVMMSVTKLTNGPDALDTTYRYTRTKPFRVESTVRWAEFEPSRKLRFEGEWAGPMQPIGTFVLEPEAGATKVRAVLQPNLRGPMRLAGPLIARSVRKESVGNFARLTEILESGKDAQGPTVPRP